MSLVKVNDRRVDEKKVDLILVEDFLDKRGILDKESVVELTEKEFVGVRPAVKFTVNERLLKTEPEEAGALVAGLLGIAVRPRVIIPAGISDEREFEKALGGVLGMEPVAEFLVLGWEVDLHSVADEMAGKGWEIGEEDEGGEEEGEEGDRVAAKKG